MKRSHQIMIRFCVRVSRNSLPEQLDWVVFILQNGTSNPFFLLSSDPSPPAPQPATRNKE